jgi:putative oxidoreductase
LPDNCRPLKTLYRRLLSSTAPKHTVLIRVLIGWVFVSEGIQKFLVNGLGTDRFTKASITAPAFTALFIGVAEIVFWDIDPGGPRNTVVRHSTSE